MTRHNLKLKIAQDEAFKKLEFLTKKGALIELKEIRKKRTTTQNSALWLYFTQCAEVLNDIGFYNKIKLITGNEIEVKWNKDSIHDNIWIPLQYAAYKTTSTTDLTTNQITPIYDTICKWMSDLGVLVIFPNQFDAYLKMYK